ncbi:MAG: vWA domain-containing protein [Myxococcota bacterium]
MWTPRILALVALISLPIAANADEPDELEELEEPRDVSRLELHAASGFVFAQREVTLRCPEGEERSLKSDAQGRIELDRQWDTEGCVVLVDHEGEVWMRSIGAERADLEVINLARVPTSIDLGEGRTVSFEEFRNIPVGSSTSRDFTAVVESSATASRDSAGISLAGTTGAESRYSVDVGGQQVAAGRLTAGAVDDVRSTKSFREFLATLGDEPGAIHRRFVRPRHIVQVVDRRGRPLAGARVSVAGREFRTRRDGRVVLVPGWDRLESQGLPMRVEADGASRTVPLRLGAEQRVALLSNASDSNASDRRSSRVDLALVLDTTGSMGDEIQYLQAELGTLLSRLDARYGALDIRWSLVVYRDEGDEYVARTYDFTRDFEGFSAALAGQGANGGGDAPEAVHTAFEHAQQLSWRDASVATRVLLHVADAPPHQDKVPAALQAADGLRAAGTAIYPVAASGVDGTAELSMRAMAMFSGGQYVFLTDDSGIGNPHREATAACFKVEPLIEVLGRILEAEMAGKRPVLPKGARGGGCPKSQREPVARSPTVEPRRRYHPLERSLFDDDAETDFLHRPRTITLRP